MLLKAIVIILMVVASVNTIQISEPKDDYQKVIVNGDTFFVDHDGVLLGAEQHANIIKHTRAGLP